MNNDKLYGFYYNTMIYESADCLMSLHRTKKGAEMALDYHKDGKKREHDEYVSYWLEKGDTIDEISKFGEFEKWSVEEVEIKD